MVTRRGIKVPVPRQYVQWLREWCEDEWLQLKAARRVAGADLERLWNSFDDRLDVRREVLLARLSQFTRGM